MTDTNKAIGKRMALITWVLGIILLTQFFGIWEEKQINPNQRPEGVSYHDGRKEIELKQNRMGHYVVNGKVNDAPATFLLDTGATDVVIPEGLVDTFGLDTWGSVRVQTANGTIQVKNTVLSSLSIDNITLYNVRATVNPNMPKDQKILLGMSALRQLEMRQVGSVLTLIQN